MSNLSQSKPDGLACFEDLKKYHEYLDKAAELERKARGLTYMAKKYRNFAWLLQIKLKEDLRL